MVHHRPNSPAAQVIEMPRARRDGWIACGQNNWPEGETADKASVRQFVKTWIEEHTKGKVDKVEEKLLEGMKKEFVVHAHCTAEADCTRKWRFEMVEGVVTWRAQGEHGAATSEVVDARVRHAKRVSGLNPLAVTQLQFGSFLNLFSVTVDACLPFFIMRPRVQGIC